MQINLLRQMRITGVITQGAKRMGKPEYVKSYKVAFSEDGETWRMYIDKGSDQDQVSSVLTAFEKGAFVPPESCCLRIVCTGTFGHES